MVMESHYQVSRVPESRFYDALTDVGWHVSRDTIAKIEGQTRWVGDGELAFLARSLGVALEALFPATVRRSLRAK